MSVLAVLADVDRATLYRARSGRVSEDMRERLSPVIRAALDGKLRLPADKPAPPRSESLADRRA
jgi:hypothetical protein